MFKITLTGESRRQTNQEFLNLSVRLFSAPLLVPLFLLAFNYMCCGVKLSVHAGIVQEFPRVINAKCPRLSSQLICVGGGGAIYFELWELEEAGIELNCRSGEC
jgi:hypothetical protein